MWVHDVHVSAMVGVWGYMMHMCVQGWGCESVATSVHDVYVCARMGVCECGYIST